MKGKSYRYDKETGKMVEVVPENVLFLPKTPEYPSLEKYSTKELEEWLAKLKALWPGVPIIKTLEEEIATRKTKPR